MRTFISIDIPKEVHNDIFKIQEELPFFEGKKTELENLHLTLKFLGEIDEKKLKLIKSRLERVNVKSFEATITKIGFFCNRKIIIWLHIDGCYFLQKEIDRVLKDLFKPEKRFMSHLTIARVKKLENKNEFIKKLKDIKIPKIKFRVNNFNFKESILTFNGPLYKTIKSYALN